MGQKVNPIGFRTGVMIGWKSRWYASKKEFADLLVEDFKIRKFVKDKHKFAGIAQLVAEDIAEQLTRRSAFRRTMKRAMESTMEAGAKGIKIQLAGRLGGAEMARREKQMSGSVPLSTLRAKIDWGFTEAKTAQGHIGVQVWINNGTYEEGGEDGNNAETGQAPKRTKKAYKR